MQNNIPQSPIPLLPAYTDPRIISQRSCFTLFGSRLNGFYKDGKEIVCSCCERRIRHKIIIDGTKKTKFAKRVIKNRYFLFSSIFWIRGNYSRFE